MGFEKRTFTPEEKRRASWFLLPATVVVVFAFSLLTDDWPFWQVLLLAPVVGLGIAAVGWATGLSKPAWTWRSSR